MSIQRVRRDHAETYREAKALGDLDGVDTPEIAANAVCTCWSELKEFGP